MRMSVKKDILLLASTRNAAKSPDKDLVVGVHARPTGLRLEHTEKLLFIMNR